ncbi:hypothetical protein, conserved [Plasmodium ovale wallikeri]|uniref:Uncharacterized protein n=1 Tax=Plasmodium ovale wallikeri TaxID=864142 RepID=A0A1A8YVR4_PLAOA|nr:hypothetical protein, conserved [Plasmodium ovale wallikeri]
MSTTQIGLIGKKAMLIPGGKSKLPVARGSINGEAKEKKQKRSKGEEKEKQGRSKGEAREKQRRSKGEAREKQRRSKGEAKGNYQKGER